MQPRLIKGLQAEFIEAYYPGCNTSGLIVYHDRVLVMMDQCSPTTKGGVQLPEDMIDRMTEASESGVICALGPDAFQFHEDGTRWTGLKPKVGDRVYTERYAGVRAMGVDGRLYRIMEHRCICAGLDPVVIEEAEEKAA